MRVLVADDDPGTRLLVSTAVERLGHHCSVAADGREAWERYQQERPDVVITDWDMPGMDGTALARAIRGHRASSYAYVLVLTGVADEEDARATMEAGADDLMLKPLDYSQLERKLIAAGRVTALHRQIHRDARHDTVTGVANRLRLAEDIAALCGRVERYGHVYCVALFGVDRFNGLDEIARDRALRAVADVLRGTIRSGDAVYRYGRDEFLVMLPEQPLESGVIAADRLRAQVEARSYPHPGGGTVTVSVGVAGLAGQPCRPDDVFERASQAVRRAREAGPNRVEVDRVVSAPEVSGVRIVVADDDPAIRLTLSALLTRAEGVELVGEAPDAAAAIELVARRRPDVVLLDVDMPGGGGVRAAVEIREASPATRVVALSADSSQAAMLDMSRAGAVGYLVKGADESEIVRVIRSAARW